MEQNTPTPSSQKLSAALATAQTAVAGANAVHSLAEMAQRDLDAALQLLADRAQYITGASGAAIALRRDGRNDMLCRASAGSNAPELGALLSAEFGLSGESVRTRQLLRCDDAERDARVNREVCRQLGIASVVVMPVVNDDQVLGVFELFSGKAHAFGERDLSAVQRLSEMVETAVRLAHATEKLPEQLKEQAIAAEAEIQEGQFLSDLVVEEPQAAPVEAKLHEDVPVNVPKAVSIELPKASMISVPSAPAPNTAPVQVTTPQAVPAEPAALAAASSQTVTALPASVPASPEPPASEPAASPKKTLFWSAAPDLDTEATKSEDDQAHVPAVLRALHKCVACGFPVSAGRMLCVECEEKKWRGQLRSSQAASRSAAVKPAAPLRVPTPAEPAKPVAQAFAAAAPSTAKAVRVVPIPAPSAASALKTPAQPPLSTSISQTADELKKDVRQATATVAATTPAASDAQAATVVRAVEAASRDFVLSAGLEPSQSWLSRNKYVLGVLLAIAAAAAAIIFLR